MLSWSAAITVLVALLLTGLTIGLWSIRVPKNHNGRRAVLLLFIPATLWAWESVIRETLLPYYPGVQWEVLDSIMGLVSLTAVVLVFRWAIRGRW